MVNALREKYCTNEAWRAFGKALFLIALFVQLFTGCDFLKVPAGEYVQTKRPEGKPIECIIISPDGNRVFFGNSAGEIWACHVETETTRQINKVASGDLLTGGILSLAISSDGRHLLAGCADNTVHLVDISSGKIIQTLKGHGGAVWSVAFFQNGQLALSGSTSDHTIRLWNLETGKQLRKMEAEDRVQGLAISPDQQIFIAPEFKTVQIWEVATGKRLRSLEGHRYRVEAVAFTPDGRSIVSASLGNIRVWDAKTGNCLRSFGDGDLLVEGFALSRDGRRVLVCGQKEVQLWDVSTGKELQRWNKLDGPLRVVFSSDGRHAIVGDGGGVVRIWKITESQRPSPDE